jgi:hypothetical protein
MNGSQDPKDENRTPVIEEPHTAHAGIKFPFDVVVIADGGASTNLSPSEFFALPLAKRITYVVQQKASFFVEGRAIDSREVLGHMRKIRANLH